MNINQAKDILIENFLSSVGHKPAYSKGDDLYYFSPLRKERTPSFIVHRSKNRWVDYGFDKRTNDILDLVQQMYSDVFNVSDALEKLDSLSFSASSTYQSRVTKTIEKKKSSLELISTEKIIKKALFYYLQERGLNIDIAKAWYKQVNFRTEGSENIQYALGFQNDVKSFELRNKIFKGFIGDKKTITTRNISDGNKVTIFESSFDFVSFLTDFNIHDFQSGLIILNSTVFEQEARKVLEATNFSQAYFFLDNDKSGEDTFCSLSSNLPYPIVNKSSIYSGFKDYNEYLVHKKYGI
jgi:hypothetical protein